LISAWEIRMPEEKKLKAEVKKKKFKGKTPDSYYGTMRKWKPSTQTSSTYNPKSPSRIYK
jgi:hypothetical protein